MSIETNVFCPAKRVGEKYRVCQKCGRKFEVRSRNQKFCPKHSTSWLKMTKSMRADLT